MPPAYLRGPAIPPVSDAYEMGCTGKLQQTRTMAMAVLRRRRGRPRMTPGSAYECPRCGFWHLTSKPGQANHLNKEGVR